MPQTADALDPHFVSRLNSLDLQAKMIVEGYFAGLHKSPYHGFSVEFSEYRPYLPGESVRHLDWKKFAKSDRYVVREFEDDTNLKAHLLLDASGSMGFTSGRHPSKLRYGVLLASALAYLLLHQRDAIGASLLGPIRKTLIPPRTTRGQLQRVLALFHNAKAGAGEPAGSALSALADKLGRKGLVVILSDFLEDLEAFLRGFRHLRYLGQDVIVFHLLDPLEDRFDLRSPSTFQDLETTQRIAFDPLRVRKEYLSALKSHREALESECRKIRVDLNTVTTDSPFDKALTAFLQKRSGLRYA